MTKKDYVAIAAAIRGVRGSRELSSSRLCVDIVAANLCEVFGDDNGRFDKVRFLRACGYNHRDR